MLLKQSSATTTRPFLRGFMKRFCSIAVVMFLLCLTAQAWAVPSKPTMTYETNKLNITVTWTEVPYATGYTLYYAAYPYTNGDPIGSLDRGSNTSYSIELWEGASYYIAVEAYNDQGNSGYSNIELFTIDPLDVDNDGDLFSENEGDCDDTDPLYYPSATDVCGDSIDQDCNGYDLTIDILRADYRVVRDGLVVWATSGLNSEALLQVDIPGLGVQSMTWNMSKQLWKIAIRDASLHGFNPDTPGIEIIVNGHEGELSATINIL